MLYKFELIDDNFKILEFDSDEQAKHEAVFGDYFEIDVLNVIKLDNDFNELETIF